MVLPVTAAEKVKDAPARMFAVAGLTATVTVPEDVGEGFGVGVVVLEPEEVLPQAVSANAVNKSKEPANTGRIRGF